MSTMLNLKSAISQFEALQNTHAQFGAGDTEPDGVFQFLLWNAFQGQPVEVPTSARAWQLYSSRPGAGSVARVLARVARQAVAAVKGCTIKERAAVEEYLSSYCWRCGY